jgi:ferric-dicitrate binding protein FerR (iron transport regulator)
MSLKDHEILELSEICGAAVDGTLTEAQRERLSRYLRESEHARRHYVLAMGQSASLLHYAAEVHTDAPDATVGSGRVFPLVLKWAALFAAAAALFMGFSQFHLSTLEEAGGTARPSDFVGRITGARRTQWVAGNFATGTHIRKGQKLDLAAGVVEVTFDSGAQVVLDGEVSLLINSAWDVTLRRGTLKAIVPTEAVGFRVSNRAVEVVDLGTEFTMVADAGSAEVFVLKGEVEAAPRDPGQDAILMKEGTARRFALTGVSAVDDSARKFALFTEPLALDRLSLVTRLLHWSFDEAVDGAFRATPADEAARKFDVRLQGAATASVSGRRGQAIRFSGQNFAVARFPGLSSNTPHTVAFWARVPEDAPLSDAYSMVTWFANNRKLGNRHVGINWNRDRSDGPIGALRTDFGGGQAVGLTNLRDGRWHHIAVCFSPGDEDPTVPVQVKQYVDGRLESSTIIPGKTRGPAVSENAALADLVWLGARLGANGPRQQRFRGELDEFFIADRGLEPQEIVSLMIDNRLPSVTIAAH